MPTRSEAPKQPTTKAILMKICSCGQAITSTSFVSKMGKPSLKTETNSVWIHPATPQDSHFDGNNFVVTRWISLIYTIGDCIHELRVSNGKSSTTKEGAEKEAIATAKTICNWEAYQQLKLFK